MIKGVNLQVVEVNNPAGEYFERILYIVKPEFSDVSRSKLLREAENLNKGGLSAPPRTGRRKGKLLRWVVGGALFLAAACAAAGIFLIVR